MANVLETIKDPTLRKWLSEFKNEQTQRSYRTGLRCFKQKLGIKDLGKYLQSKPDAIGDLRKFLAALEGRPSKTLNNYVGSVRMFLQDHHVELDETAWRKMRRRGFMPKRIRAETKDKKPSKAQLKQILNFADIKCRSLVLFLVSAGARIGETLQLRIEDFELEADPPRVNIKDEYTKGGVGGRTVYFSYEARDAITDWLKVKDTLKRRGTGQPYTGPVMFPYIDSTARWMFNTACDKAGLGIRDNGTGRRVLHLHSLRKFFRTKIGLDLDTTHALMGHAEYLDDAYLRLEESGEIAKAYLEAMPNVSVYAVENQELREQTSAMEQENVELKRRIESTEQRLSALERMIAEIRELVG